MHFCNKCENMYYIRISQEDGNKLIYYCRNCGNEDQYLTKENICVSKIELKRSEQKYSHIINKYTKLDPTLPRTTTIKCPNQQCLSNSSGDDKVEREVIYIRYDDINIKYVYLCSICDTLWRTDELK
jgi:DNA-directed RNA polymerase subunit M/transcription elongation factor TFIIS